MSDNDEDIGRLLRLAGARDHMPAERAHRVRTAIRAQWREQARTRARNRTLAWSGAALAAAALLMVSTRVAMRVTPADPGLIVGTSEMSGESLRAGSWIETTAGHLESLRLSTGVGVRIDANTRLRVLTPSSVELERGRIYVDSGPAADARSTGIEIHTKFGVARDVGTRFEVQIGSSNLRLRVRDGEVELRDSRTSHHARPGDEFTLDAAGGLARRKVAVYGPEWDWAVDLAKPFEIEGRSLRDFLDWIAGENGWRLEFADPDIDEKSYTTILSGSIQGLTPVEALASVLPASGVPYQLENGVLLVGRGSGGSQD